MESYIVQWLKEISILQLKKTLSNKENNRQVKDNKNSKFSSWELILTNQSKLSPNQGMEFMLS